MTNSPSMPHGLSAFCWTLMHVIDSGQSATIEEAYAHIEDGSVVDWLQQLAGDWAVRTGIPGIMTSEDRAYVLDVLERHQNASSPGDYGISANGLCLLLAYCLDEIQIILTADD